MTKVDVRTALQQLPRLLASALAGEEIIVTGPENTAVKLVSVVPVAGSPPYRRAGTAQGQIVMSPDFDAPLDEFAEYLS